jgi:hypothetical protein
MIHKRFITSLILSIIIFLLVVSCSAAPTTAPVPTNGPASSSSAAPTNKPVAFTSDTGALKVQLISSVTHKPLDNALIRFATMLFGTGTLKGVYIPSLDSQNSPGEMTDSQGTVVFSNIKPGKYGLAYIFPIGMPEMIRVEGADQDLMFDIVANQVLDLGSLQVMVNPDQLN